MLVFFFFKQKTAYEMRISDWSSDVCSSDLYHFQKAQAADGLIDIWGADHAGTVKRIKAAVAALTGGKTRFDVKLVQMVRLPKNEIGRASCRERVCQYV